MIFPVSVTESHIISFLLTFHSFVALNQRKKERERERERWGGEYERGEAKGWR